MSLKPKTILILKKCLQQFLEIMSNNLTFFSELKLQPLKSQNFDAAKAFFYYKKYIILYYDDMCMCV